MMFHRRGTGVGLLRWVLIGGAGRGVSTAEHPKSQHTVAEPEEHSPPARSPRSLDPILKTSGPPSKQRLLSGIVSVP